MDLFLLVSFHGLLDNAFHKLRCQRARNIAENIAPLRIDHKGGGKSVNPILLEHLSRGVHDNGEGMVVFRQKRLHGFNVFVLAIGVFLEFFGLATPSTTRSSRFPP